MKNPAGWRVFLLPHAVTRFTCTFTFLGDLVPFHGSGFIFVTIDVANRNTFIVIQIVQFTLVQTGCNFAFADIAADRHFAQNAELVLALAARLGAFVRFGRVCGISRVARCRHAIAP